MNHLLDGDNSALKDFNIFFVGFKKDVHNFEYAIESSFFEEFENSPITEGVLKVDLEFTKKNRFFELDFQIEGKVKAECDRCSEEFYLGIEVEDLVIVQLANAEKILDNSDLDALRIPADSISINVAHLIYEIVVLSLPLRKSCSEDSIDGKKCNPKILKILNKGQKQTKEKTDPRWEALLKLKNNNNK